MNSIFSLPQNNVKSDWLIFLVMILAIGVAVGFVIVWMVIYRPKNKKKRKHKHRHHRRHNPTLAETGGLPPMRDRNQPPPGP